MSPRPIDDPQRVYLAKTVPWPKTKEDGYVNIWWMSPNTNGGDKLQFAGRAVHTIDEAIRTIAWIGSKPDTLGVYACMSRQSMAEERVSANGFKYLNARKSQATAIDLKSIFLDIDFKDFKHRDEAVSEFARFLKESNLPKPSVLVQSGN